MIIYTIYKIVNQLNGKVYIGFTNNINRRLSEHKLRHTHYKNKFYNAVRKYGWDNFILEILYQSKDGLDCKNTMEPFFIKEYDTFVNGYNSTSGGEGVFGYTHNNKSINKMKKPKSEKHKNNLKVSRNKRTDLPMLGKKHSEETKIKLSKISKGKPNIKLMKKVMTPDGIFESVTAAAKYYNHNIFYMSRKIKKNPAKFFFI